jgi:4-amino-4-deoxy-L-arabinose transferase-like glycosyltransferase
MRAAAWIAIGVIAAIYATLIVRNISFAAGGPDESGYMNEARLLRSGRLHLPIEPLRTLHVDRSYSDLFNPLGFVPEPPGTITPSYPAGYPIHLLIAAMIGGWSRAPFFVAPLMAFGTIVLMYAVARKLGLAPAYAVGAAAILALVPTFALQSLQIMSDVPATFWVLLAMYFALWRTGTPTRPADRQECLSSIAAGVAFGIAVWVRPSNILLAIPLAVAMQFRMRDLLRFTLGALPLGVLLMIFNAAMYGSPFTTGYGSITENLSLHSPCFHDQTLWLVKLLTPLMLPGGLLVIFDRRADAWRHRALLPVWFGVYLIFYSLWPVCDAWWYSRFLLPAIPALILGMLIVLRGWPKVATVAVLVVVAMCVRDWEKFHILRIDDDQVIYPRSIAVAERVLPRNALVVSGLLSGAFMNYSGRFTARWDRIDADRFQLLRAYAGDANLRWYAVLSEVEVSKDEFQRRLPGKWTPIARYRNVVVYQLDDQ